MVVQIQAGSHAQAAVGHHLRAKHLFQLLPGVNGKVGRGQAHFLRGKGERLLVRIFGIRLGDESLADHQVEYQPLALFGRFQVAQRVQVYRALGQRGQQAGFGQCQAGGRFVKVGLRRRFNAVGQITVVNFVQVHLQNFIFAVIPVHDPGQDDLFGFAVVGDFGTFVVIEGQVADELLGDGGCAHGTAVPIPQVGNQRRHQRGHIGAHIFVEAVVFHRNRRVD